MRLRSKWLALPPAAFILATLLVNDVDAHKAISSKYTYNDDVYPILEARCGACHVDGGVAPMSLLTYNEDGGAVAWAQSIKEMLMVRAMPPYFADPAGPAVRGREHALSPRELDILLTWAGGGTPHGDLNHMPPDTSGSVAWALGAPDATLPLPEAVTLAAGEMEKIVDVAVPTHFDGERWVRTVDLLPQQPSLVRQATLSVENGPVLAVWEPQHDALAAPAGTAFRLPAGARLALHIRYRKSWQMEQEAVTDRSTIGFYFAKGQPRAIEGLAVTRSAAGKAPMPQGGSVVAVRVSVDQPYESLAVVADTPSGPVPLLRLRGVRPEWPRRYWLKTPLKVPAAATIRVESSPQTLDMGPIGPVPDSRFEVAVEGLGGA